MTDDTRKIIHDLNNLLTAIIGAAESGLGRPNLPPEAAADFANILEGARRGAAMIRPPGGTNEPIWLNEAIRATARLLESQAAGLTLTIDLAEPDARVRLDPSALDRMLLNLVTNARQAMPSGGTLRMTTAAKRLTRPERGFPDTIPPGSHQVIPGDRQWPGDPGRDPPVPLPARRHHPSRPGRFRTRPGVGAGDGARRRWRGDAAEYRGRRHDDLHLPAQRAGTRRDRGENRAVGGG
jgi:hypothetical protein